MTKRLRETARAEQKRLDLVKGPDALADGFQQAIPSVVGEPYGRGAVTKRRLRQTSERIEEPQIAGRLRSITAYAEEPGDSPCGHTAFDKRARHAFEIQPRDQPKEADPSDRIDQRARLGERDEFSPLWISR